ncbi:UNVERIFIED_CONTAM: hypothetical protein GTU68_041078 [Idotea baltica]|nr:hypothetical protein [Idotea baltica]
MVLESMKMEIEVQTHQSGKVNRILRTAGSQVNAGQSIVFLEPN